MVHIALVQDVNNRGKSQKWEYGAERVYAFV